MNDKASLRCEAKKVLDMAKSRAIYLYPLNFQNQVKNIGRVEDRDIG